MSRILVTLSLMLMPWCMYATHRITFTIRYYPQLDQVLDVEQLQKSIQDPTRAIQTIMRTTISTNGASGIVVTYAGFTTISTIYGQVDLPRRQQKTSFHVLVSTDFEPVMMAGVTVYHWQLLPNANAAMYTVTLQQDPDTKVHFWDVQPAELPADKVIPLDTIVIVAKPQNILLPTGITTAKNSINLILPDMYAKKSADFWSDALNFLQVKHFYRTIKSIDKQYSPIYWANQLKP